MNPQKNKDWLSLLPDEISEFLTSFEFSDILQDIRLKYKLLEEPGAKRAEESKAWKLTKIVAEVLKGNLNPSNFEEILREQLEFDSKTIKKIAEEVDQKIFSKVRMSLKRMYEEKEAEKELPRIREEKPTPLEKKDVYREQIE